MEYEKNRANSMKELMKKYEELESTYREKISERTTSEREESYRKLIEEKKKSISELLVQLEISHDQNSFLKKEVEVK